MAAGDSIEPPVQSLVTLPPYPEMILSAIKELNNKDGSNKSAISKQIESTYGELPPAHSTLLTHHLNNMKKSSQLTFSKNNYFIPDPNSPPPRSRGRPPKLKFDHVGGHPNGSPRSRGRPPKPKSDDVPSAPVGTPRPRGRPPKVVDPNAPPPTPKPVSSGRGRGRPPKKSKAGGNVVSGTTVVGVKRGRGRPPKVKAEVAPVGV